MKYLLPCFLLLVVTSLGWFGMRHPRHVQTAPATAAEGTRAVPAEAPALGRSQQTDAAVDGHTEPGIVSAATSPSAASEFSEAKRCHQAAVGTRTWQAQLNMCKVEASKLHPPSVPCENDGAELEVKLKDAEKALATCSPVPAEIRENYYRATLEAAKQGDADAQLCYMNSDFDVHRPHSPSEVDEFKAAAATYAEEGIQRGDWRMVELLGRPHRKHPRNFSLRSLIADGEPYTMYKMNRLLRLGADGAYADKLDRLLGISLDELSQRQVTEAEEWAADTFSKYFSDSPKLTEEPTFCESR